MDFVVVGFGVGSLAVLVGLLLREAATWRLRRSDADGVDGRRAVVGQRLRGSGRLVALAGAAVAAVTLGALLAGAGDRVGALLVTGAATLAAVGVFVSVVVEARRSPLPAARPRARPAPTALAPPPLAVAIERGLARAGTGDDDASEAAAVVASAPVEGDAVEADDEPLVVGLDGHSEAAADMATAVDVPVEPGGGATTLPGANGRIVDEVGAEPTGGLAPAAEDRTERELVAATIEPDGRDPAPAAVGDEP